MGEQVSLMIHLGDRLGLYRHLHDAGPLTTVEVAEGTGLDERLVREWLLSQAAAKLVDRHDDGRFELTPVQAALLADEEGSLSFAAGRLPGWERPRPCRGAGGVVPNRPRRLLRTAGHRSRRGPGPHDGAVVAAGADVGHPPPRSTVSSRSSENGGTVVDVGCGAGVTCLTIAQAFPREPLHRLRPVIDRRRPGRRRRGRGGAHQRVVRGGRGRGPARRPRRRPGDLLRLPPRHAVPRPGGRPRSGARSMMTEPGSSRTSGSTGSFEKDRRNPLLAMFYGFSVASCLPVGAVRTRGHGSRPRSGCTRRLRNRWCGAQASSTFLQPRFRRRRQPLLRGPGQLTTAHTPHPSVSPHPPAPGDRRLPIHLGGS